MVPPRIRVVIEEGQHAAEILNGRPRNSRECRRISPRRGLFFPLNNLLRPISHFSVALLDQSYVRQGPEWLLSCFLPENIVLPHPFQRQERAA